MITVNVRGRDLAGFVADAQKKVAEQLELPADYHLEWGGTFENLQSATKRLAIVVPIALVMIFILLFATFGSVKLGLLIFVSVPLGAIGRRAGALGAGDEFQHLGGGRVHRSLRRRGS